MSRKLKALIIALAAVVSVSSFTAFAEESGTLSSGNEINFEDPFDTDTSAVDTDTDTSADTSADTSTDTADDTATDTSGGETDTESPSTDTSDDTTTSPTTSTTTTSTATTTTTKRYTTTTSRGTSKKTTTTSKKSTTVIEEEEPIDQSPEDILTGGGSDKDTDSDKAESCVVTAEQLEKAKSGGEDIMVYGTTADGLNYSWKIIASTITETKKDIDLTISTDSRNSSKIKSIIPSGASFQVLSIAYSGNLPFEASVAINTDLNVGTYYLYYFNNSTAKAEVLKTVKVVEDANNGKNKVAFKIDHCSDYFLSSVELAETSQGIPLYIKSLLLIAVGLLLAGILGLVIGRVLNKGKNSDEDEDEEDLSDDEYYSNGANAPDTEFIAPEDDDDDVSGDDYYVYGAKEPDNDIIYEDEDFDDGIGVAIYDEDIIYEDDD